MSEESDNDRRERRARELPTAILDLARNDAIVSRSLHRFVAGHIITPTECLCQMVADLSHTLHATRQQLCDKAAADPIRMVVPANRGRLPK